MRLSRVKTERMTFNWVKRSSNVQGGKRGKEGREKEEKRVSEMLAGSPTGGKSCFWLFTLSRRSACCFILFPSVPLTHLTFSLFFFLHTLGGEVLRVVLHYIRHSLLFSLTFSDLYLLPASLVLFAPCPSTPEAQRFVHGIGITTSPAFV